MSEALEALGYLQRYWLSPREYWRDYARWPRKEGQITEKAFEVKGGPAEVIVVRECRSDRLRPLSDDPVRR